MSDQLASIDTARFFLAETLSREDLARALEATSGDGQASASESPPGGQAGGSPPATLVKRNESRGVWQLVLDGRALYMKRYRRGRFHYSRARREVAFAQLLAAHGVPTQQVLACSWLTGDEWMVSEAVEPAVPGDQWHLEMVLRDDEPSRRAVSQAAAALGDLVGRMHRAGIVHRDLHGGNVLVRTDGPAPQLVLLDLHRMRRARSLMSLPGLRGRPRLSRRARTVDLAQLYHDRVNFTRAADRLRFLKHYLAAAGAEGSLSGWSAMIEQFARRHGRRQLARRDRRIFTRNRYFTPLRLGRGWRANVVLQSKRRLADSAAAAMRFDPRDWQAALSRPEGLFRGQDVEVIKDSPSSLVVRRRLRVGPHEVDVFIKRSRRKRSGRLLWDCFRPSRSRRAFELGHVLLTRRIAIALPLAALERRLGPVLVDNILITEAVGAPQLHRFLDTYLCPSPRGDALLSESQQRHLAQQVLGRLGELVRRLHDNDLAHRDLKASNLLVQWIPGRAPELILVDLDGLRQARWLTSQNRFQGLMRLNVSLLECPVVNHAGRLRMLKGYLRRPGTGRLDYKPYWRVLEDWSARKLRRQIRSRRRRQRAVRRPGP